MRSLALVRRRQRFERQPVPGIETREVLSQGAAHPARVNPNDIHKLEYVQRDMTPAEK